MKSSFRILIAFCLAMMNTGVQAAAQTAPDYDALVQQGKIQLQAGSNDAALASANATIKLNPDRWEAYALAGGALINLHRCDEAKADLEQAIGKAPEAKQAGLRTLNGTCVAAGTGDSSGPSYSQTVQYIQDKMRDAGDSIGGATLDGIVNGAPGVADKITYDNALYTFSADGCRSMTITRKMGSHNDDWSEDDHSWHHKDGQEIRTFTIPFKSVAAASDFGINKGNSQGASLVFSTHDPTPPPPGVYGTTTLFADGWFGLNKYLDGMISQLPMTKAIESGAGDHQDWHDAVWIVPKDLGVSWTYSDNSGDDPIDQSGNINHSGTPMLVIRFAEPGKGVTSTHVAKAIQHLVDLCDSHPDQGPKELF